MDTLTPTTTASAMTRRSFARIGAAAALAAVAGTLTLSGALARETESGDDHGGHGRGNDDTKPDDHGGKRKKKKNTRK